MIILEIELYNKGIRRKRMKIFLVAVPKVKGCYIGMSRIWSLRFWRAEKVHHVLTIEVDPKRRAVVQARGRTNRPAAGKPLRLLQDWAARERLQLAI